MLTKKLVLDLETQKSFQEVGGKANIEALKISIVGVYDYDTDQYRGYEEHEMSELEKVLKKTKTIIGFNSIDFDLLVLKPYLQEVTIDQFDNVDIMVELQKAIGYRVSLDRVAGATLGTKKSGHGLQAVEWFREGKIDKIRDYCLDDVKVTKETYDYGIKNKHLKFEGAWGSYQVPVSYT